MCTTYNFDSNVTSMLPYLEKVEDLHHDLPTTTRSSIDKLMGEAYLLMFDNVTGKLQPIKYKKSRDLIMGDLDRIHSKYGIPINGTSMLYKLEPLIANWVNNGYYQAQLNW